MATSALEIQQCIVHMLVAKVSACPLLQGVCFQQNKKKSICLLVLNLSHWHFIHHCCLRTLWRTADPYNAISSCPPESFHLCFICVAIQIFHWVGHICLYVCACRCVICSVIQHGFSQCSFPLLHETAQLGSLLTGNLPRRFLWGKYAACVLTNTATPSNFHLLQRATQSLDIQGEKIAQPKRNLAPNYPICYFT